MRQICILLLLTFFIGPKVKAELISGFDVYNAHLSAGKIILNSATPTTFKAKLRFTRDLVTGTNSYESADINFKFVAIDIVSGTIKDLTTLYNIKTSDFGTSNWVERDYNVTANFSTLNISINNLRIIVLWKSISFTPPQNYPNGLYVLEAPKYQAVLVDPTPLPPLGVISGKLVLETTSGAIYLGVDGFYRHIEQMETVKALFNYTLLDALLIKQNTIPQPTGDPIGAGAAGIQNAFLARDNADGKVYFVEVKRVPYLGLPTVRYNLCRYIPHPSILTHFKFDQTKIQNLNMQFSSTISQNAWVIGNDFTGADNPPAYSNGVLFQDQTTTKLYWAFDGTFRHITTAETFVALFGTWPYYTVQGAGAPLPLGTPIGVPASGVSYAFLAKDINDQKIYFVEKKKIDESNANSPYYNYCRHLTTTSIFNSYGLNASKVVDYNIQFSAIPSQDNWVLGPPVTN